MGIIASAALAAAAVALADSPGEMASSGDHRGKATMSWATDGYAFRFTADELPTGQWQVRLQRRWDATESWETLWSSVASERPLVAENL